MREFSGSWPWLASVCAALTFLPLAGLAQGHQGHPIRLIPFDAAGGPIDSVARLPDVRERLIESGLAPLANTPQEFPARFRVDLLRIPS